MGISSAHGGATVEISTAHAAQRTVRGGCTAGLTPGRCDTMARGARGGAGIRFGSTRIPAGSIGGRTSARAYLGAFGCASVAGFRGERPKRGRRGNLRELAGAVKVRGRSRG